MNKVIIVFFLAFFLMFCSDGMKTGQKIDTIIKDNDIEYLVLVHNNCGGEANTVELKIEDIVIEDQFLKSENEYVNLGLVKVFKVKGKKLEVEF